MPNRLANETSPYLLQHADNPVDWYPWGEEAFRVAREQGKPILLSVGYSTCHWCHVMAHESFEDPEIARLMNEWFVNVKVDREERPDVDAVYMAAVQAMTGQGGWPMTVFLTPDGKPFFAGTYFPPEDAHGRPSFRRVLEAVHRAWETDRERVLESAEHVARELRRFAEAVGGGRAAVSTQQLDDAVRALAATFDPQWGGFGGPPKFPVAPVLEWLLIHHARTEREGRDDGQAWAMVRHTLAAMATGGIYDQLGGGFARYSVDARWVVPHFEKMLYDNAQLLRVYLHAWQIERDPLWERVVRETAEYLLRELRDPAGGFYSAQDADSEGLEGKFYLWTREEVRAVLGDEDAELACQYFGVTQEGNFVDPHHPELTGRNVLTRRADESALAARFGLTAEELQSRIERARRLLFEARRKRIPPATDDKVLTSWNGLAIRGLAEAGWVLGEPRYVQAAAEAARFLRTVMWKDGELLHAYRAGVARVPGMLEDYAYLGLGLVELYRASGDLEHLEWALRLLERLRARFRDRERGGLFETGDEAEPLLFRQKPFFDAATPSGNAAAAELAFWVWRYYQDAEARALADEIVGQVGEHLSKAPSGFGALLGVAELLHAPLEELVLLGTAAEREPFLRVVAGHFRPWLVLLPASDPRGLPHFAGRESAPRPVAFFCRNMACDLPATTPELLGRQLAT